MVALLAIQIVFDFLRNYLTESCGLNEIIVNDLCTFVTVLTISCVLESLLTPKDADNRRRSRRVMLVCCLLAVAIEIIIDLSAINELHFLVKKYVDGSKTIENYAMNMKHLALKRNLRMEFIMYTAYFAGLYIIWDSKKEIDTTAVKEIGRFWARLILLSFAVIVLFS